MACAIGLSRILREDRATKDGFFNSCLGCGRAAAVMKKALNLWIRAFQDLSPALQQSCEAQAETSISRGRSTSGLPSSRRSSSGRAAGGRGPSADSVRRRRPSAGPCRPLQRPSWWRPSERGRSEQRRHRSSWPVQEPARWTCGCCPAFSSREAKKA